MSLSVLYASLDFEPITVINLPQWAENLLMNEQHVRFFLPDPPAVLYSASKFGASPGGATKFVTVWGEPMYRGRIKKLMLFTEDEELALLLRPSILPGQQKDYQWAQQRAFEKGFLKALKILR